jgi:hypothetical protein
MSSPPIQPWGTASLSVHDWSAGSPAPRLGWFGQGATLPPELDRAAAALGIVAEPVALDRLTAGGIVSHTLIWAYLGEDPGESVLIKLRDRITEEALNLVIEVSRSSIDPVWAVLGDTTGVTILLEPDEGDCLAALAQGARASEARLNSPMVEARDRQLERLQEEVQRIARLLARLNIDDSARIASMPDGSRGPASPFIEDHMHAPVRGFHGETDDAPMTPVSSAHVRTLIRHRRIRDEYFGPDIFADPAWDMMLDLYAARLERLRVSVSSLCIAAAVPATTALRWIKTLTESGLFERREDPHDGRRIFVALSDGATQAMHRYFQRIDAHF